MNILRNSACIALVATSLMGCEMADNAKKSAENSGVASQNSTKLLDLNQSAYGDGRQGGSRDRRENALQTMLKAHSLDNKLQAAGAFMQAFEFQLYKEEGFREDDEAKRERLYTSAVSELLKTQKDFSKVKFAEAQLGQVIAGSNTDFYSPANALAFAGALSQLSERQREGATRFGFTAKSMLDVFFEAIAVSKVANEDPAALALQPLYVYEALKELDEVVYLLQLRMNLTAGTALQKLMSSVKFSQEKAEFEIVGGAVKLKDVTDRLRATLQVKMALAQAGIAPEYCVDVAAGYKGFLAKLGQTEMVNSNQKIMPLFLEAKALAEKI